MLTSFAFFTLLLVCFFSIDDLFVDLWAFVKRLGPKEISNDELQALRALPEKNIAIIVANWQEADVIARMVAGNLKRIDYTNYHFFLGVYPNDIATALAVQSVAAAFPKQVHVVENSRPGPTVKGQMLNQIVQQVLREEDRMGLKFDVFLMHDSEDILHPLSLRVINAEIAKTDFLQIPVFSFDRPIKQWVGSTYIDEFAEIHTKELFVRQSMGAAVPSAGVGTAIQRRLMLTLMKDNNLNFLREDSLTEDYILGMSSASKGFQTSFCCYYVRNQDGKKDFIATREFFPNRFSAAVRQKTRWIVGIVLQGTQLIPWTGNFAHKYFLYRDRRGPINNFVAMCTTLLTTYVLSYYFWRHLLPEFMFTWWFHVGSVIATTGMISRIYHRLKAVIVVNGWKKAWAVLLRWPVGNLINFVASVRALRQFLTSTVLKRQIQWVKTTHELPEGFGQSDDAQARKDDLHVD